MGGAVRCDRVGDAGDGVIASPAAFALLLLVVPTTAKVALIGVQYGAARRLVRRLRAEPDAA